MSTTTMIPTGVIRAIDALNALLRGEHAAVRTYEQAIESFGAVVPQELSESLRSHRHRIPLLARRVVELGGMPAADGGMWARFAALVEGGAALFGRKAALAALEEGEDHGLALYQERIKDLDPESRMKVETEILPEQVQSHAMIRALQTFGV